MGQLQGSYLALNQPIAVNDYLCSPSRSFFALMQSNGTFCIYKGSSPQHNQLLFWSTLKCGTETAAQAGQFFAILQSDGNFCVYQGSGPNDFQAPAVWCTMNIAGGGQFFAMMQDSGNFCVFMGTGPDDNRGLLWDTFSHPMNPMQYNLRMNDVEVAFNAVSKKGNNHSFTGGVDASVVKSHVQGIADYQDYFILTHSHDVGTGYLVVLDGKDKKVAYVMDTPDTNYTHPGGCQRIGSILAVPIENLSSHKSNIHFYNLTGMTDSEAHQPQLMALKIDRSTKKAGGVGITSRMEANGLEYHYLAVSFADDKKIDFYKSNGRPLTDAACSFTLISTVTLDKTGYSEICLVTESSEDQQIYLIGFRVHEKNAGLEYEDLVDLYRVFPEDYKADLVKTRHLYTVYGNGVSGVAGVHFRWGAGLKIMSETRMKFYATQRNFAFNYFYTNTFT